MRITELLDIRSIALDAAPKSKQETLDAAVALMVKSGKITDEDAYRAQVYAREEESTTGIGEIIQYHQRIQKTQGNSTFLGSFLFVKIYEFVSNSNKLVTH